MKVCLVSHKYQVPLNDPAIYPIGFMYVSTFFKSLGHDVKVLNYNLWDYDLEEETRGYDIVCFTGFEQFRNQILNDEKICIENGCKTIIGGALATFDGIPDFKGLKVTGEFPGYGVDWYNRNYPDYEGFRIDEYNRRHDIKYIGVLTTYGCPYHCTFCAQTCEFQMRDIDSVFSEIDYYVKNYGIEFISFNDNTLNINKQRFMKICRGMKERNLPWAAAVRAAPFDDEMARTAKDSNCEYIIIGVESFNQNKLNMMNKQIKKWQITRSLDLLEKYKIKYHSNILVGFENETCGDIFLEILSMPTGYNVFPFLVQNFIGTKNGKERNISEYKYRIIDESLRRNVEQSGKYYCDGIGYTC